MRWQRTPRKDMPSMYTSPLAWEKTWQADFERCYGPELPHTFSELWPERLVSEIAASSDVAVTHEDRRRRLCRHQEQVVRWIAGAFAERDLERKWKVLDAARREEVVLEGVCRAFQGPNADYSRMWCPDSSVKHLVAKDGDVFLGMLKAFLPSDICAQIAEPLTIPCSLVDKLLALTPEEQNHAGYRTFAMHEKLNRAQCITAVLSNIIEVFYGYDRRPQRVIKPNGAKHEDLGQFAHLLPFVREIRRDMLKELKRHCGPVQKFKACFRCGKTEDHLEGEVLRRCTGCAQKERNVWYCSRECQSEDWKFGTPVPHKTVCGKPWSTDFMAQPTSQLQRQGDNVAWLPPADPMFNRPPALQYQLLLLKHYPDTDYVLMNPDNKALKLLVLMPFASHKRYFLLHRNSAFRTGSHASVSKVLQMLCHSIATEELRHQFPPVAVARQLEAELGVCLDDALASMVPLLNVEMQEYQTCSQEELDCIEAAMDNATDELDID